MIKATVDPGICGLKATITARKKDKSSVEIEIESQCSKVVEMAASFSKMTIREALRLQTESRVYQFASENNLCSSCAIPIGILKSIEIEMGLALPKPVTVNFDTIS
jgi:hypothetical protein